jgi:uncharacterized protein DUF4232
VPSPAPAASYVPPWASKTAAPILSSAPKCRARDLVATPGGGGGALGTFYARVVLSTKSDVPCTLHDLPTVVLVDQNGAQLGQPADPVHDERDSRAVTITRDMHPYLLVGFPGAWNYPDPSPCSVPAVEMRLFVSSGSNWFTTPTQYPWCPGFHVRGFVLQEG